MRLLKPRQEHDCEWRLRAETLEAELARLRRELSLEDPATGLCNDVRFFRELGRALSRAKRTGAPFSVVLVEVHSASRGAVPREVLLKVAERLAATARREDAVARMGTGQMGVILAETGASGTGEFLRRLSRILGGEQWGEPGSKIFLSAKVGTAAWSPNVTTTIDQLMEAAVADLSRFDQGLESERDLFGEAM